MRAVWAACIAVVMLANSLSAQTFSGLARVDGGQSAVEDAQGDLVVTLYLSQAVPWRVFTLEGPERLVLDFREVDWRGADPVEMLRSPQATGLRFGPLRPGWSRMVLDLAGPLAVAEAGMRVSEVDGTAVVRVVLEETTAAQFAELAGAPDDPNWTATPAPVTLPSPSPQDDGVLVVAIDAGHGGIDPGAQQGGLIEAELMLRYARELSDALSGAEGLRAVMIRDADVFVSLQGRMTIARAAGADVLISLHADSLAEDSATGLSIYTLSQRAADTASQRMAERHEAGDLLAGLDLSGADDRVATVLMDLARLETGPASDRLADTLVTALDDAGVRLNSRPRREGPLAVLSAADFPSVLVEVGFMSNAEDRARLLDPQARQAVVAGIVAGLQRWQAAEAARAPLNRQ